MGPTRISSKIPRKAKNNLATYLSWNSLKQPSESRANYCNVHCNSTKNTIDYLENPSSQNKRLTSNPSKPQIVQTASSPHDVLQLQLRKKTIMTKTCGVTRTVKLLTKHLTMNQAHHALKWRRSCHQTPQTSSTTLITKTIKETGFYKPLTFLSCKFLSSVISLP